MTDKDVLYEAAKLAQFGACDSLWWRHNNLVGSSADADGLMVFATCNDVFEWGTADAEEITADNLPVLRQAITDVQELTGSEYDNQADAFLLFVARVRQQRPQGAMYKYITVRRRDEAEQERLTAALRALFDAAGPEREVNLLNPKAQP